MVKLVSTTYTFSSRPHRKINLQKLTNQERVRVLRQGCLVEVWSQVGREVK